MLFSVTTDLECEVADFLRLEMGLNVRGCNVFNAGVAPLRLVVFIYDKGAHAFAKLPHLEGFKRDPVFEG